MKTQKYNLLVNHNVAGIKHFIIGCHLAPVPRHHKCGLPYRLKSRKSPYGFFPARAVGKKRFRRGHPMTLCPIK